MRKGFDATMYSYDAHRYLFDVRIPAILSSIAVPAACMMLAFDFLAPIATVLLLVSAYSLFNTFIAKAYPEVVTLDDEALSLTSFGRTDIYRIDGIERLQVRENGMRRHAYIRVNGGGLTRGRYFVACGDMYDETGRKAEELYRFFLETEARLDPDNLRVRARAASACKVVEAAGNFEEVEAPQSHHHRRKKK